MSNLKTKEPAARSMLHHVKTMCVGWFPVSELFLQPIISGNSYIYKLRKKIISLKGGFQERLLQYIL